MGRRRWRPALTNKDVPFPEFPSDEGRRHVGTISEIVSPEWRPPSLVGPTGTTTDSGLDWR